VNFKFLIYLYYKITTYICEEKKKINMKNILKKTFILIFLSSFTSAFAADTTIEMLNKSGKEIMVFSNKIVSVNVGDTVFWKATSKGHNVEFIKGGTPEGVPKFKSKMNKDVEFKFEKPGIYAYWCTPHKMMGMIGFVVVGNDKSNLEAIKSIKFVGKSKKLASELFDQL
jgi:pseudoazurin